jgi:hypothetical protein
VAISAKQYRSKQEIVLDVYAICADVVIKNEILVTMQGTNNVKILKITSNYVTLAC